MSRTKIIFLIIAVGCLLRFAEYLPNRSLWLDEATVANRVSQVPLLTLVDGRSDSQLAYPFGFLFLEKAAVFCFRDNSEWILRLFPFLFGVAALVLFCFLAEKALERKSASLAMFLFAINPMAVYYSSEVKPYSLDLFFSVFVCWIFYRALSFLDASRLRRFLWLAGIAVAGWFSYGAVFILFGGGAALLLYCWIWGKREEIFRIGQILSIGAASFALNYFFIVRRFVSNAGLQGTWEFVYPGSALGDFFIWIYRALDCFFKMILNYPFWFALLFCFLGAAGLYRINRKILAIFLGAFFSVFLASAFHVYPFMGRMVLFLLPLFILVIGAGFDLLEGLPKLLRIVTGIVFASSIIFFPSKVALRQFSEPFAQQEIKPVLAFLSKHFKKGEKIYIFKKSVPAFQYYKRRFNFPEEDCIYGEVSGGNRQAYRQEVIRISTSENVWILYSHMLGKEAALLQEEINRSGRVEKTHYEMLSASDIPPGYLKRDCLTAGVFLCHFAGGERGRGK